jgi:hypothetical protein
MGDPDPLCAERLERKFSEIKGNTNTRENWILYV